MAVDSDTSTPRILKRSATPLQEVNEILSQVKAQQLLTIIDACRNDPSSGRGSQDNLLSADFARGFKIQRRTNSSGKPAVGATFFMLVISVNELMSGLRPITIRSRRSGSACRAEPS